MQGVISVDKSTIIKDIEHVIIGTLTECIHKGILFWFERGAEADRSVGYRDFAWAMNIKYFYIICFVLS